MKRRIILSVEVEVEVDERSDFTPTADEIVATLKNHVYESFDPSGPIQLDDYNEKGDFSIYAKLDAQQLLDRPAEIVGKYFSPYNEDQLVLMVTSDLGLFEKYVKVCGEPAAQFHSKEEALSYAAEFGSQARDGVRSELSVDCKEFMESEIAKAEKK